ncbi:translocase of chloroplast 120, chloroplastic-like protein [Tanacetum coccineum]
MTGFLSRLVTKICHVLTTRMTTVDDDEVAPRRNAGRTFKVADQLHEDVNGKDALVTDEKDDDSVKQNDKKMKISHFSESVADSSQIREQKDEDKPLNKEPESRPVIGVSLSTAKSVTPTPTPVPNPKDDPKPKETPTPNSRPNTPPTLRPFLAPVLTRPAGLGRGAPLLEPAHRVAQSQANGNVSPPQNQVIDEPTNGEAEENDETREKLQMIRVKFLRLARRLGQTHNVVVAQVLYRLGLVEQLRGRTGGRVAAFSFERASAMAEQLEAAGQEPLEFSCTIMVLGKTGVGKSATINSIFDEVKFRTDAFQLGTKKVQDVVGTVQGIKVRVIDTPGLLPFWADQRKNQKILQSVKKFIQKSPPDIVLYLDRLDMQSRDDMPLLRTITDIFGQSIWFNTIVVLTHAASAPPEGPNGTATSYDMFVTQRSHVVQQAIRQAAGDMRLMNPVSLVENHSACRTNRNGQRVLPNGQVWKPHLLLLSFASKILVEANMLLKLQGSPPGKPFAARNQAPPLPYILSTLLQSRPQLKLPQEQFGDDDDDALDDDIDESSDEESSEYDELPPFKRLTNAQVSTLSKAQKKSYYDELEYREKLFMKKQLKEEKKRRKMMKKMAEAAKNFPTELTDNNVEEDSNAAATVPVAVQDMTLPASFDADNPTQRYRALDSANQWLIRPVLDPHGWDHDVGYEGINVEHLLALKEKIPVSFSGQVTKDKKDANLQMEVSSAMKHGKSKSTTVAFDMQTFGKEMSYSLHSGVKFEDKLMINKRGELVVAEGAVIARDLALGWNAQSQIPIGRSTNLISRVNLNNKGSGQVSVSLNSSDQLQIALAALVPLIEESYVVYAAGLQPVDSQHVSRNVLFRDGWEERDVRDAVGFAFVAAVERACCSGVENAGWRERTTEPLRRASLRIERTALPSGRGCGRRRDGRSRRLSGLSEREACVVFSSGIDRRGEIYCFVGQVSRLSVFRSSWGRIELRSVGGEKSAYGCLPAERRALCWEKVDIEERLGRKRWEENKTLAEEIVESVATMMAFDVISDDVEVGWEFAGCQNLDPCCVLHPRQHDLRAKWLPASLLVHIILPIGIELGFCTPVVIVDLSPRSTPELRDNFCEELRAEFLGFSNSSGGNPTPTSEPFTSKFILEEIEVYLKDDSISPKIDYADCDPEEDICLIKKLLNNDSFQLPPIDLKQSEVTEAKSLIEEPPELELKDLLSHLEYAYLEENNKLPVIIAKGLNDDEK